MIVWQNLKIRAYFSGRNYPEGFVSLNGCRLSKNYLFGVTSSLSHLSSLVNPMNWKKILLLLPAPLSRICLILSAENVPLCDVTYYVNVTLKNTKLLT